MPNKIRVTIWNEFIHEQTSDDVKKIYPHGIHHAIAKFLAENNDMQIQTDARH